MLDHAVSLNDAQTAALRTHEQVVGYRFSNPGVVGEFYPSAQLSSEEFLSLFAARYGGEPLITELVATSRSISQRTLPSTNQLIADEGVTAGLQEEVNAPDAPTGTVAMDVAANRPSEVVPATGVMALPGAATAVPPIQISKDWRPSTSSLSLSGTRSSANRVGFSLYNYWITDPGAGIEGEDFSKVPPHWGVEFRVQLHNLSIEQSNPSAVRTPTSTGICPSTPDVRNQFWAKNGTFQSWSVWHIGTQTLDSIGGYADTNDQTDACGSQTFSVGIAYPSAVGRTPNRNYEFGIDVFATPGSVDRNLITSTIEAVESYSCQVFPYTVPDTNCMGADTTRVWPVTNVPKSWILLPRTGAATPAAPTVPFPIYTSDSGLPNYCVTSVRSKTPINGCV